MVHKIVFSKKEQILIFVELFNYYILLMKFILEVKRIIYKITIEIWLIRYIN